MLFRSSREIGFSRKKQAPSARAFLATLTFISEDMTAWKFKLSSSYYTRRNFCKPNIPNRKLKINSKPTYDRDLLLVQYTQKRKTVHIWHVNVSHYKLIVILLFRNHGQSNRCHLGCGHWKKNTRLSWIPFNMKINQVAKNKHQDQITLKLWIYIKKYISSLSNMFWLSFPTISISVFFHGLPQDLCSQNKMFKLLI